MLHWIWVWLPCFRLVPNWKRLWKAFSVWVPLLNIAIITTWQMLPDELKLALPDSWVLTVAKVLMVVGVAGRLLQQGLGQDPPMEAVEMK